MFFLTEPSEQMVTRFIATQTDLPLTYRAVGATRYKAPDKFTVDHNRVQLGRGEISYNRAVSAMKSWRHFDLGWVSIVPEGIAVEVGAIVAVKARAFGSWSLNATRIVYVVDEESETRRFGFAYGTLPGHVECGEERFLIEWNKADDSVWYDILAFSKPQHPLVRMSFPLARLLQKRFARESLQRMEREVL
jgi:uncharacterized protein (UPF0548 family)